MLSIAIALIVVFGLLILAEYLRRKRRIQGELARKFVHMSVGSFVAFWPFFMTWNEIRLMCLAFIIVVLLDRHFRIFKSVHSVKRQTVGDILFPVGIAIATYVSSSPWIFTVAVLHLSLGDGMAAVVGNKYGKQYAYSILRQKKSFAGSVAFWGTSLIITGVMLAFMPINLQYASLAILLLLPLSSTLLESISIFGIDNVTIPVFVALILSSLQSIG